MNILTWIVVIFQHLMLMIIFTDGAKMMIAVLVTGEVTAFYTISKLRTYIEETNHRIHLTVVTFYGKCIHHIYK